MKKTFFSIIILPIIFMLLQFSNNDKLDPVDQVGIKISKNLATKYKLRHCGIGGGATKQGTWLINSEFDYQGTPLTMLEARKLIINIAQDFLKEFNQEKSIRSYLRDYPFSAQNLSLGVYCYDDKGEIIPDPFITIVGTSNNKVSYFRQDPIDTYKYKPTLYESYEEALAIVRGQKK